jgi:hypothetical protein
MKWRNRAYRRERWGGGKQKAEFLGACFFLFPRCGPHPHHDNGKGAGRGGTAAEIGGECTKRGKSTRESKERQERGFKRLCDDHGWGWERGGWGTCVRASCVYVRVYRPEVNEQCRAERFEDGWRPEEEAGHGPHTSNPTLSMLLLLPPQSRRRRQSCRGCQTPPPSPLSCTLALFQRWGNAPVARPPSLPRSL